MLLSNSCSNAHVFCFNNVESWPYHWGYFCLIRVSARSITSLSIPHGLTKSSGSNMPLFQPSRDRYLPDFPWWLFCGSPHTYLVVLWWCPWTTISCHNIHSYGSLSNPSFNRHSPSSTHLGVLGTLGHGWQPQTSISNSTRHICSNGFGRSKLNHAL